MSGQTMADAASPSETCCRQSHLRNTFSSFPAPLSRAKAVRPVDPQLGPPAFAGVSGEWETGLQVRSEDGPPYHLRRPRVTNDERAKGKRKGGKTKPHGLMPARAKRSAQMSRPSGREQRRAKTKAAPRRSRPERCLPDTASRRSGSGLHLIAPPPASRRRDPPQALH